MPTRRDPAGKPPRTKPATPPGAVRPANVPAGNARPSNGNLANGHASTEPSEPASFGHRFQNPALLRLALTHSSLAYEASHDAAPDPGEDNEQLEFIGDAVLSLVVAEALYRRFPGSREGELTRLRASLVSSRNLAQVALRLNLGAMLHLGRGEAQSGGRAKPALLANALEAVIAALYLDGGLAAAAAFIHRDIVEPALSSLVHAVGSAGPFSGAIGDYKSALQERLQAIGVGQPKYVLAGQTGPDHQKHFRIEVHIASPGGTTTALAAAEGTTKKQAQQEAARLALASLLRGDLAPLMPVSTNGASAKPVEPTR